MVLAGPLEIVNYAAGNSSVSLVLSKPPARIHTFRQLIIFAESISAILYASTAVEKPTIPYME